MNAKRIDGNIVLTLEPEEAHVLIWGGRTDAYNAILSLLRTTLVDVEDNEYSDAEYSAAFADLDSVYDAIVERESPKR